MNVTESFPPPPSRPKMPPGPFEGEVTIAPGYYVEVIISELIAVYCLCIPIIQLINFCKHRAVRKKFHRFHIVIYSTMIVNGVVGIILGLDVSGVFLIHSIPSRLIGYYVLVGNCFIELTEWASNVFKCALVLKGRVPDDLHRTVLVTKLVCILGYCTSASIACSLALTKDQLHWALIPISYLAAMCALFLFAQLYGVRHLHRHNLKMSKMITSDDETLDERFQVPAARLILAIAGMSILICGLTGLSISYAITWNSNQTLEDYFQRNDPQTYEVNPPLAIGLIATMVMIVVSSFVGWIPIGHEKAGDDSSSNSKAKPLLEGRSLSLIYINPRSKEEDWVTRITNKVLWSTWKLVGRRIFTLPSVARASSKISECKLIELNQNKIIPKLNSIPEEEDV
jgi:hypothetical protein